MITTLEEFNEYSGNMEDSERAVNLKNVFLSSSEELVSEYLRFKPEEKWETVPGIVKLTILRIATLMLMEAGENINRRNNAMSDYAELIGEGDLMAKSVPATIKYLSPLQTFREIKF